MKSRSMILLSTLSLLGLAIAAAGCRRSAEGTATAADATRGSSAAADKDLQGEAKMEQACFAAGCFWGVESALRQLPGVTDAVCGYTGGKSDKPTYKEVCTDRTGHAEAVLVEFDPAKISYEKLLDFFWRMHNPTTLNRQGPDVGSQYRSAIFYFTPEQKAAAEASKERLQQSGKFRQPIVTQIVPAAAFHRAEEYHQRYFEKHGGPACHVPSE